ncbi:MAG TPA: YCF48-related protein [Oligoflexus sp.]|uniref:YCF48-related protein n=1 Tax=Oligoflexus sp. TaxID=1971216 RepID=UPI002D6156AC|nr:YCF48-related protein [Oligoflexus sp.]HYX37816.1 YCF48-related protein [Oligoflexus sp.]
MENLDPTALVWEKVSIPDAENLTGVMFSFDDGLIVGENGFIAETHDGGDSFNRVTIQSANTRANLLTIDNNTSQMIGGEGIMLRRSSISGMPAGSYTWSAHQGSDLPTIRDLACFTDCMAVGSTKSGSSILKIDIDGNIEEVQASGLKAQLNSIAWAPGGYLAVGGNGTFLKRSGEG